MARETLLSRRERKTRTMPVNLVVPADDEAKVIKIDSTKESRIPSKELPEIPFSAWKMPPQQEGYLKSTHNDCL